ncbi:hypothetical protein MIND_01398100 [Mycena indigotica]|uniref:Uncharacterized protein n=1 Tax=Mycena indigotica TaxID=2126181 RepID=A0A8H6RZ51_9AGAR|nr:uncharacterized protein MIND_01398100 [Mycena indigotica]KAF7289358.1 hypothetical protein MIND_01398100 [Mycena indigotica]
MTGFFASNTNLDKMSRICMLTTRFLVLGTALAILALFTPSSSQQLSPPNPSPDCASPPPDTCSFYADCLESRYHCGPSGYPLGYGQYYCTKFQAARSTLSPAGQKWMLATLHCLQLALVDDALGRPNATSTCQQLEDKAFASHAGCYVDNGVCKLPPSDWEAIIKIVDITTLFDSWDAFKATLTAGTECLEMWLFLGKRTVHLWS